MKYLFTSLFFYACCISAQKYVEPDKIKQFNITVNQDDQIVKTQILKNPKKIHINYDATYVWYTSNKLLETRGGYDGKLVHGYYKAFFFNNQLKESGEIKYGLKSGKWHYWYSTGMLREVITWKNGKKTGRYTIYNDQGKRMARGHFKNDFLHGKFYTYDNYGKVSEKKKYKNGNEVSKAPRIKNRKADRRSLYDNGEKQPKPLKQKKSKERKTDHPTKETKLQQDSAKKENFFKRLFKKKKPTPKVEPTPTEIHA